MIKITKEQKDFNIIIFLFSAIIGFSMAGILKSNIPSISPVTLRSLQESTMEINALKDEIVGIKELVGEKERELARIEDSKLEDKKEILEKSYKDAEILAGKKSIKGEGIIVRMEDNLEEGVVGEELDLDVIHDADVLRIINDLRTAGAEAISVNGQRVLAFSEIKCGGPIIRVNGKSLATPFYIKAIGDTKTLTAAINAPNTYAYALKTIEQLNIDIKTQDEIIIPSYEREYNFKYAKPVKGGE